MSEVQRPHAPQAGHPRRKCRQLLLGLQPVPVLPRDTTDGRHRRARCQVKKNHVLIDYENVQPNVATALGPDIFEVWVFLGVQQTKVKVDLLELLERKGKDGAHVVRLASVGRNALDFHISCYLGQLIAREPDSYFHIISRDTGLDPLIDHLRGLGHHVSRWNDVSGIPVAKLATSLTEDDQLSHIIEYLVRRGAQRPASMKTLLGSIGALFNPPLDQDVATRLAQSLQEHGVFELAGNRLQYALPEG